MKLIFSKKNQKKSFTLVEMMIVVAIIAVLSGAAIPQYNKYIKKSEITEGINFIRQIVDAEILYHAINDSYLHVYLPNAMQKLGYNIPSNAKFKYYQVQACGNNGFIASVSTQYSMLSNKTIYKFYPSSMNSKPTGKENFYNGSLMTQHYIQDEDLGAKPICP